MLSFSGVETANPGAIVQNWVSSFGECKPGFRIQFGFGIIHVTKYAYNYARQSNKDGFLQGSQLFHDGNFVTVSTGILMVDDFVWVPIPAFIEETLFIANCNVCYSSFILAI